MTSGKNLKAVRAKTEKVKCGRNRKLKQIRENFAALEGERVSADQMIRSLRADLDQETGLRKEEETCQSNVPERARS